MTQTFDDAGKIGTEMMETGLKSFAALSKNLQSISMEATDFSKQAFENGSTAFEKLMSAKSLDKAIEVQSDYAKTAYEAFVSEASRMGDLYADMAKEVYQPFENTVAKAK